MNIDFDAESFANRVFVFPLVEAAHRDVAVLIAECFSGDHESVGNGVEEFGFRPLLWLFAVIRRHFAGIDLV